VEGLGSSSLLLRTLLNLKKEDKKKRAKPRIIGRRRSGDGKRKKTAS
jgi:hypothetical protein